MRAAGAFSQDGRRRAGWMDRSAAPESERSIMLTKESWTGMFLAVLLCGGLHAQVTQRVSLSSNGIQGNGASGIYGISTSADGRYVAFSSSATNLVARDTNGTPDIFVRDRWTGAIERISVSSAGAQGDYGHIAPSITPDGRYVAFASDSTRLVGDDTNWKQDIFVRDRQIGTTERVSLSSSGAQANGMCYTTSISADGRFVAFQSDATNLVPGDTNSCSDVFVRDRLNGTTERISVDSAGVQGNAESEFPAISGDGRYIAFISLAGNLTSDDTNGAWDVFAHDRQTGITERISVGSPTGWGGFYRAPSISFDGRCVAFRSPANDLVPGDTNGLDDIFVRDRQLGVTERVSVDSSGGESNGPSFASAISADGRYVAFSSNGSNLVPGDTNGFMDVFVHDRQTGTTERMSVASNGAQGTGESFELSISGDGNIVAFESLASDLVPGDTNATVDVFVRVRSGGTSFTSSCDPGTGGVLACPCSNPPSGPERGCDNSSGTGGAVLAASGGSYLSSDSLVFQTSGERSTALTVLFQAKDPVPSGIVYGQGVRCAGGLLKRLYSKSASGGSITAPDFGAGEPTVSARSAEKGDSILSGESRWYFATYRDPIVLGGCPSASTFNVTQTGRVTWAP